MIRSARPRILKYSCLATSYDDGLVLPEPSQEVTTPEKTISLVALLTVLLRRRRLVAGTACAFALFTALLLVVKPRTYTVEASFIIQGGDQNAAASLAAQLGVAVNGDANRSPAFFAELLRTPNVLAPLADTTFTTSGDDRSRSLAQIWGISGGDSLVRRAAVTDRLRRAISSGVGQKTDLVTVAVSTRDGALSKQLTTAILSQVNRFNLVSRQSRASAERQFTEQRMLELAVEVRTAEDTYQKFLQDNRQPNLSAELEFAKGRLAERVTLLRQTYLSVATAFERARIDEVRDTPVITIVQQPEVPSRPDPLGLIKKTVLMLVLGLIVGAIAAVAREEMAWLKVARETDAVELVALISVTRSELRRLPSAAARLLSAKRRANPRDP